MQKMRHLATTSPEGAHVLHIVYAALGTDVSCRCDSCDILSLVAPVICPSICIVQMCAGGTNQHEGLLPAGNCAQAEVECTHPGAVRTHARLHAPRKCSQRCGRLKPAKRGCCETRSSCYVYLAVPSTFSAQRVNAYLASGVLAVLPSVHSSSAFSGIRRCRSATRSRSHVQLQTTVHMLCL